MALNIITPNLYLNILVFSYYLQNKTLACVRPCVRACVRAWVSEWVSVLRQFRNFSAISYRGEFDFQWDNDDEVHFVLDQHAELDLHGASSLKQQSADRHVAPPEHIILIPSQPVFTPSPSCCVLSGEATQINFIVFGLTRPGLEPTIYHTRGEHANHYATDAVV